MTNSSTLPDQLGVTASRERHRVDSPARMWAEFTTAAGLRRLEADAVSLLLYPASELQDGLVRLYLRRRAETIEATPLLGLASSSRIGWEVDGPRVTSEVDGIRAVVRFRLSARERAWFWHVRLTNTSTEPIELDILHTHDVALASYGAVRTNEYYVSQYLDLTPVDVPGHGPAIAVRQNMPGPSHPWAIVGCLGEATGWATDALQLTGRTRLDGEPWQGLTADLPSARLQHEHTLVALQTAPVTLAPGESRDTGFYGILVADHPDATAERDAEHALRALDDPAATLPADPDVSGAEEAVVPSLFAAARVLACEPESGGRPPDARHVEERDGIALSWFTPAGAHVATAAKQRSVLRPHGHILRTGSALVPDERGVTATAWMAGTFLSHVTQGHVSLGSLVSARRTYLGLMPAHGLRMFVAEPESPDDWSLLAVPTLWEITPDRCRWEYRTVDRTLEVTVTAPTEAHELRLQVVSDRPVRLLVAVHISVGGDDGQDDVPPPVTSDAGGVAIGPEGALRLSWPEGSVETVADDAPLRTSGRASRAPWVTLTVPPTTDWQLAVRPQLVDDAGPDVPREPLDARFWTKVADAIRLVPASAGHDADEIARIDSILPWFEHDALIHYLSPRGLEQFTGGGWGTRDVSQGPICLLTALGAQPAMREVVIRVLKAQNERGDWPQAFDFYARHVHYSQQEAHGDVVYWPLLALGEYLEATGDATLLEERVPFVGDGEATSQASVAVHVERALDVIEASRIAGTSLPAYGNGDWNDSLQPADPRLAAGLVSTWTVTLQAHALGTLFRALQTLGRGDGAETSGTERARLVARARKLAEEGATAMLDLLVADGVLAGYGLFDPDADDATPQRPSRLLVHPSDALTGLRYSLLPMIHAISGDLLPPDSAKAHLALIREHLTGPDGARLFDRPPRYTGGPMEVFLRAEAATFFGREIGLMYMHAHLRYAEALARMGDAAGLLRALALANPIDVTGRVASARPRQATTYFSSSDAAFPDRYAAAADYERAIDGTVPLESGWRVYSSGPGIYLRLVVEQMLGIRRRGARIEIDPVLPASLDSLTAHVPLLDGTVELRYRVTGAGSGVSAVRVDDALVATAPLVNPYRAPGVAVATADVAAALENGRATLTIEVG